MGNEVVRTVKRNPCEYVSTPVTQLVPIALITPIASLPHHVACALDVEATRVTGIVKGAFARHSAP